MNGLRIYESTKFADGKVLQSNRSEGTHENKTTLDEGSKDVADRKKFKNQSILALKRQSMGVFAGKLAHDFNNILGVILASSSTIEMNTSSSTICQESLKAINNAVGRGTELMSQILTIAGKIDLSKQTVAVPDLIQDFFSKLKNMYPANIEFRKIIGNNIPCIWADAKKMQQILLSICANAREAMPNGGTITIQVKNIAGKDLQARYLSVDRDQYVGISISDTGCGMDDSIKDMVFDPFFTTKGKGKNSGLGLSVAYGLIEAHSGFIDVESKLGQGSTFNLYFPGISMAQQESDTSGITALPSDQKIETILVVEDEKCLLDLATLMLESKGYRVRTAKDGFEAIDVYRQYQDEISLVFSDIGLPGLNGREVFAKLREMKPGVKVIFTSGIFVDIKSELIKSGAKDFIQKPYTQEEVLRKMREVLNAR